VAVDYFLKIDGIEGESTDAKHAGWIDVDAWSWGESLPTPPATGSGAGVGKVRFDAFQFTTRVSKASPKLFLACASGQHIREARLVGQRAGSKAPQEFLAYTFADVFVDSYQTGGAEGGDQPMDNVSLNVSKVTVEYKAQKADGSLDAAVTAGWDSKTNKKV
jgi:type VI secretion system secreted protein Hcp